jgi:hypothetical protein
MLSPVWRAKLCNINALTSNQSHCLYFEVSEEIAISKLLQLGLGQQITADSFSELIEIGKAADCYGITTICQAVEWEAIRLLTSERAAEALSNSGAAGLTDLQQASRELALARFESFAISEAFLQLSGAAAASLLGDWRLNTTCEERVLEAAVRWVQGAPEASLRGREGLLETVRFGAISSAYLVDTARTLLPISDTLCRLVDEALAARIRTTYEPARRRGLAPIAWELYERGGTQCLHACQSPSGRHGPVSAALCRGLVCWGTNDGTLLITNGGAAGPAAGPRLVAKIPTGTADSLRALAGWRGLLFCAMERGDITVWDVAAPTRGPVGRLSGHAERVNALAVTQGGELLVSGSGDGEVRVWGPGREPLCWAVRRVGNVGPGLVSIAAAGTRAYFGRPGWVIVWDLMGAGDSERVFAQFAGGCVAMAMAAGRLFTAGERLIRAWSLETGGCLGSVEAYPASVGQELTSLAAHGGWLVTGSRRTGPGVSGGRGLEVCVWDGGTLLLERVVTVTVDSEHPAPPGLEGVSCLLAVEAGVLGAVGGEMVVWGGGPGGPLTEQERAAGWEGPV